MSKGGRFMTVHRGRLAALILVLGLLGSGIYLYVKNTSTTAADYIKRAEAHRQAGDLQASVIDLKNALQKDGHNPHARLLLGQIYFELGDPTSAESTLLRALEEGAPRGEVYRPLEEARLAERTYKQVLDDTAEPGSLPPALKATALALRSRAYLGLGQVDKAKDAATAALDADNHSSDALAAGAYLALAQSNVPKARALIEEAQKAAPADIDLVEMAGDIAFFGSDFTTAQEAYKRALSLRRGNLSLRLKLARAEIATNNLTDAIANIESVLKIAPKDPTTNYLRALAAYQGKDYNNSQKYSETALALNKDFLPALLIAGASSFALSHMEQANAYLNRYVFAVPANLTARKLLAATQARLGRPKEAVEILQGAGEKGAKDVQLLMMIGSATARTGDFATAAQYFEKAASERPDDPAIRTQLGLAKVASGEVDSGIEDLRRATEEDTTLGQPEVALVYSLLRTKQYDKALEAANRFQERQPNNPLGFTLTGLAYIGKGDRTAARAAFEKAREINPADPSATRYLAQLMLAEGNRDQAQAYYREVIKSHPEDVLSYLSLAQLEVQSQHPDEAQAILKEAIQANPKALLPHVILARLLLVRGKPREALAEIDPFRSEFPDDTSLLDVLGRTQLALGQIDDATNTFKTLVKVVPNAGLAHEELASAYEAANRIDDAMAEIDKAAELNPQNPGVKFTKARLLARSGKLADATKLLDELKTAFPKDPGVAELEGLVALAERHPTEAVPAFERAVQLRDNNVNRARLAEALAQAGRAAEAEQTLKSWLKEHPDDILSRSTLASIYVTTNRLADSRAQYEEILKRQPNNALAENNLAWILAQQGQTSTALTHAQHAVELAPQLPEVLDTLGTIQLQSGKVEDALKTLRTASQERPAARDIQFHFAQALAQHGDKDQAIEILQRLLGDQQPFRERQQADLLLRKLKG